MIPGGAWPLKAPPLSFSSQGFKFRASLLCVEVFSPQKSFILCGNKKTVTAWAQDLAIRWVSIFIVNLIFITSCKLNIMLEIADSPTCEHVVK